MLDLEVGDADRAGATVGAELLQRLPRGDEVAAVKGRERPMDQEQVDVIEAELVELASNARRASSGRW
jgi:protein-tyrosine phosphatase